MIKFVLMLLLLTTTKVHADLIITFENSTVSSGGTGFIDVFIGSTGSDDLVLVGYEFSIAGADANGSLQFRDTLNQIDDEQNDSRYVFAGDTDPLNFLAARQDPTVTGLAGTDFANSLTDVTLSSFDAPRLLARLELEHVTTTPSAAIGDTFAISLIPVGSLFQDSAMVLNASTDSLPFSSIPGTITITSAAVPEPSSLMFVGITAAFVIGRVRLQQRRSSGSST
ncbi:MAG: PEP-CTERM sorting domain-containing protein [Planctomycetaceae bacterium]|nr:PEP-CTERM sorting domain-containing protein [Planctomycetaceae bacterium]